MLAAACDLRGGNGGGVGGEQKEDGTDRSFCRGGRCSGERSISTRPRRRFRRLQTRTQKVPMLSDFGVNMLQTLDILCQQIQSVHDAAFLLDRSVRLEHRKTTLLPRF